MKPLKQHLLRRRLVKIIFSSWLILFFTGVYTNSTALGQLGNIGGAVFIVNTEADDHDANLEDGVCETASGDCTLRAAIEQANFTPTVEDEIEFEPTVRRIELTKGDLEISSPLSIKKGVDQTPVTIDADNKHRIFTVKAPGVERVGEAEVVLKGLRLKNGAAIDADNDSHASIGGGILVRKDASLVLIFVEVEQCAASWKGGGVANFGDLTLINCAISGSQAGGSDDDDGNNDGKEINGMLGKNKASSALGGGIYNGGGIIDIINLDLYGNSAIEGGGMYSNGGSLSLVNATVARNHAINGGGGLNIIDIINLDLYNNIFALNEDDTNTAPDVAFRTSSGAPTTIIEEEHNLISKSEGSNILFSVNNNNVIGTSVDPIDPKFQNANQDNFRLRAQSPANNAGNIDRIPFDAYDVDEDNDLNEIIDIDLDRVPRLFESNTEMGAHERVGGFGGRCEAEGGDVHGEYQYCPQDPALGFDLTPDFGDNEPDSDYDYSFFIVNSDGFAIDNGSDLSTYVEVGDYLVCGVSYLANYPKDVPAMNGTNTLDDIRNAAQNGDFCGDVSENCAMVHIVADKSCCPTQDDIANRIVVADIVCGEAAGNALALPEVDADDIMASNYRAAFATFEWLQSEGPEVDLSDPANLLVPPNDSCDPITYRFDLQVGCTEDGEVALDGGQAEFTIYPLIGIQPGNLLEGDYACCPSMLLQCPDNYTLMNDYSGVEEEGNPECGGEDVLFEFKIILNNPPVTLEGTGCAEHAFKAVQAVSECCPKEEDAERIEETVSSCNNPAGNTFTLPSSNLATHEYASISWQQTDGIIVTVPEGDAPTITLPQQNQCAPASYTFQLTIGCEVDESVAIDGGSVTYTIYSPPVVQESEGCVLEVLANCPDTGANDLVLVEYADADGNWLETPPPGPFESGEQIAVRAYVNNSPMQDGEPICLTTLTVETEACCPQTMHVQPLADNIALCSIEEPVATILSVAGVVAIPGATYTWTQVSGEESIVVGTTSEPEISLPANPDCAPKHYIFALTIGCIFDETVALAGGTVSYQVYSPPPVTTVEGCAVHLIPNCTVTADNDLVVVEYSIDGINWAVTPPPAPFESGMETYARAYVNGSPFVDHTPICSSQEILITENCCPAVEHIQAINRQTNLCSQLGGNTLLLSSEGVINVDTETTYSWQQLDNNTTISLTADASPEIQLPENNGCEPVVYEFALSIGCSNDPTVQYDGGQVQITQYPAPQMPTINRLTADIEEGCTYEVVPFCPDDVLTPNTFSPLDLPAASGTTPISVTTGVTNSVCATTTFEVPYFGCAICPLDAELTIAQGNNGGVTPFHYNTATLTVTGALTPFNYEWDRTGYVRQTIRSVSDITTVIEIVYAQNAEWTVTITDQLGCTEIQSSNPTFDNNVLKIADAAIMPTQPQQYNGSIAIELVGGTSPYVCDWYGPQGFHATTQNVEDLRSGWYQVNVHDQTVNSQGHADPQTVTAWYWVPNVVAQGSGFIRGKQGIVENTTDFQVFPNPVINNAQIQFIAPMDSEQTTINLYSISGQKIANLFSGETKTWETYSINLSNQNLPSGVYMIELVNETGTAAQTTKLVIMD